MVACLGAGAVVALALAGGAGSSVAQQATHLLRLGAGDQVAVPGTSLHCAVSTTAPTTLVCGEGSGLTPRPKSYGFAVADSALLVLKASATSSPSLFKREPEPAHGGRTFPGPKAGGRKLSAPVNTVMTVGGTHVFCAVERLQAKTYVTCGPADGSASFFLKSYVGAVSEQDLVVIHKLDQKHTKTVLQLHQP